MGIPSKVLKNLPNGCICCSAKDDFIAAIDALFAYGATFDYIIVESTGLADPMSVIATFWVDECLGSSIYLDAVIGVVDSSRIGETLESADDELRRLATKQILCADVVLCNKTDLQEPPRALVLSINPLCRLIETQYGVTPLEEILHLTAFDPARCADKLKALTPHEHTHHSIQSVVIKVEMELCPQKVERWLSEVLWQKTCGSIIRAKGIFRGPHRTVHQMQAVGDVFEVTDISALVQGELESKFLFLGEQLQFAKLRDGLCVECHLQQQTERH